MLSCEPPTMHFGLTVVLHSRCPSPVPDSSVCRRDCLLSNLKCQLVLTGVLLLRKYNRFPKTYGFFAMLSCEPPTMHFGLTAVLRSRCPNPVPDSSARRRDCLLSNLKCQWVLKGMLLLRKYNRLGVFRSRFSQLRSGEFLILRELIFFFLWFDTNVF
uniref:Candidate secreted effector n=1 Tax=Meloidogyne incognita TaxID=6306 RepID=A0A914MPJ3_MELIC